MNNTVFERILNLFEKLGIDISQGSNGAGEARAYSAGFDLVNSTLDSVFNNIYVQTADEKGQRMFLNLIDEKYEDDAENNRQKIMNRFLHDGSFFVYSEFKDELKKTAPESTVDYKNGTIIISNFINPVTLENLTKAGRFIKKHVPVFSYVSMNGEGISFEKFENLKMRWFEIDEINLPFHILDELE